MTGQATAFEEQLAGHEVPGGLRVEGRRIPGTNRTGENIQLRIGQRKSRHPAARSLADGLPDAGLGMRAQRTGVDQAGAAIGAGGGVAVAAGAKLAVRRGDGLGGNGGSK